MIENVIGLSVTTMNTVPTEEEQVALNGPATPIDEAHMTTTEENEEPAGDALDGNLILSEGLNYLFSYENDFKTSQNLACLIAERVRDIEGFNLSFVEFAFDSTRNASKLLNIISNTTEQYLKSGQMVDSITVVTIPRDDNAWYSWVDRRRNMADQLRDMYLKFKGTFNIPMYICMIRNDTEYIGEDCPELCMLFYSKDFRVTLDIDKASVNRILLKNSTINIIKGNIPRYYNEYDLARDIVDNIDKESNSYCSLYSAAMDGDISNIIGDIQKISQIPEVKNILVLIIPRSPKYVKGLINMCDSLSTLYSKDSNNVYIAIFTDDSYSSKNLYNVIDMKEFEEGSDIDIVLSYDEDKEKSYRLG